MDVGNDVAQVLLKQIEVFFEGIPILADLMRLLVLLRAGNGGIDLLLGRGNTTDDLLAFDAHEAVNLVKLLLELLDKALLRLLVPCVVHAQRRFQFLVVDVIKEPILVERLL